MYKYSKQADIEDSIEFFCLFANEVKITFESDEHENNEKYFDVKSTCMQIKS